MVNPMVKGIPDTKNIAWNNPKQRYQVFHGKTILATCRTLIEALMCRDWCQANNWKKFTGGMRYIHWSKRDKCWHIHKDNEYYGVFYNLEDAMHERDSLVQCDWDYDLLVELE